MLRHLVCQIALVLVVVAASTANGQRFEWRDVVQTVEIRSDGNVVVADERTLWTTGDFGEAFICVELAPNQTITLLDGSGAVSPGPQASALTQRCEDRPGTELVVRQEQRVSERRVRFRYQLSGSVDFYGDVVQWYWNILEREHPPVHGYRLTVTAPGGMSAPYDAFVHRYDNTEEPTVALSEDRSRLEVAFEFIPDGDGVEIRYLMDPALFDERGSGERLQRIFEEEAELAGIARRPTMWDAVSEGVHRAFTQYLWATLLALAGVGYLGFNIVRDYLRYGREPDIGPTMRYPFEPPSDLPPAAVSAMLSQQALSAKSQVAGPGFFATIMDLARRGYGEFESKGRHFEMRLNLGKDDSELLPFEREVLGFLKAAAASGGQPDMLESRTLRRYSNRHKRRFMTGWRTQPRAWIERQRGGPLITAESKAVTQKWSLRAIIAAVLYVGLAWLTAGGGLGGVIFGAAAVVSFLLLFVANGALPAWRPEVLREVEGWRGFRRTLGNFSRMKDAPDDFFHLWDRYYCYAAALGVAERYLRNLERAMPLRDLDQGALARRGAWMGGSAVQSGSFRDVSRSISSLSRSLSAAGASASSGGSSGGGGGGGGGGSSGGR